MKSVLEQVQNYCKDLPNVYEDYPFGPDWQLFRHRLNQKSFVYLYERGGQYQMNLKCEPMRGDFWRKAFPASVSPGYHMHKTDWNTVVLDCSLPWEELCEMIEHSYEVTKPRPRKGAAKNGV